MSSAEMAVRLGVTKQAVTKLERSETLDTVRLETLRQAAAALDCDLVYALVPRRGLAEAVDAQARQKAAAQLRPISHHSRLEDQEVAGEDADARVRDLADALIDRRGLWGP